MTRLPESASAMYAMASSRRALPPGRRGRILNPALAVPGRHLRDYLPLAVNLFYS